MITVKINKKSYSFFSSYEIGLRFDSIASTFSLSAFFEPDNSDHKKIFKPLSFNTVEIFHNGKIILTGYIVNVSFGSSSIKELITISGYSKSGVLEDCSIPKSVYPIQFEGLTLAQIATKVCEPFGISVLIDSSVSSEANEVLSLDGAKETDTVKQYLVNLCNQKNLILSHNEFGNVIITRTKADQKPIQSFTDQSNAVSMSLDTKGQKMFSENFVMGQAGIDTNNAAEASVSNPYINILRSSTTLQTSGTDNDSESVASDILAKQLRGINLVMEFDNILFSNNSLFVPNKVINVINKEIYLYNVTKFFIESVTLRGDSDSETGILNCVLPEVYNKQIPTNIFG